MTQMEKQESKPNLESAKAADRGGEEVNEAVLRGKVGCYMLGKGTGLEKFPEQENKWFSSSPCRDQ